MTKDVIEQQFTCDSGHVLTFTVTFEGDKARLEVTTDAGFSCPDCLTPYLEVTKDLARKGKEAGIQVVAPPSMPKLKKRARRKRRAKKRKKRGNHDR